MPPQKVTVTIPRDTGLPGDESVNTFHFTTGVGGGKFTAAETETVADILRDFYKVAPPDNSGNAVNKYLGVCNGENVMIRFYDLAEVIDPGEKRVPYAEHSRNIGPLSTTALPEECAVCLSYRAELVTGTNPRRRRGRIFIGPLAQAATTVLAGRVRPRGEVLQTLTLAGAALQNSIRGIGLNNDWVVYSPTDDEEHTISHLWCDDAFDTMRSRGPKATGRVSVDV